MNVDFSNRMQSYELFLKMGPDKAREILMYFRDTERNVYRNALFTLAQKRNLRPVFVQKKSVPEQVDWILKEVSQKRADAVAEQLLQMWLLQARQEMLVKFLDGVGIEHDGKGAVDDLPEALDAAKVSETVSDMLGQFDATEVAIYLHVFNAQTEKGWPELSAVLEQDTRLAWS